MSTDLNCLLLDCFVKFMQQLKKYFSYQKTIFLGVYVRKVMQKLSLSWHFSHVSINNCIKYLFYHIFASLNFGKKTKILKLMTEQIAK